MHLDEYSSGVRHITVGPMTVPNRDQIRRGQWVNADEFFRQGKSCGGLACMESVAVRQVKEASTSPGFE